MTKRIQTNVDDDLLEELKRLYPDESVYKLLRTIVKSFVNSRRKRDGLPPM